MNAYRQTRNSMFLLKKQTITVLAALLLSLVLHPQTAGADTVVLTAQDTDSINTLGQNWNDNRLRAYYKVDIDHIDGFMKFDLSSIPDAAVITSMTLTTYYEGPAYQNPNVRIYRVADDSWSRASTVDPHPGLDQVLTPAHTSFPDTPLAPYTWSLDVNAADWTLDLLDNVLSLGMRNENETYSYVYWCGSDPSPAPPELTVTFIVPPNTLVLTAQDTDSINTLGQNWNDNRLRAYYKVDIDHIDGFMKFDLSSIPDAAVITSMTLTTYYEGPAYQNPNVRIYRVADDSWSRASTIDPHPGLDQVLTPGHTSFPDMPLTPHKWSLDVNAADWTLDLLDNALSLGMRNENDTYSYVYWYGSDPLPAPPLLRVTFTLTANTVVLAAQDTDSINTLGQNWNDNMLRAYYKVEIDHLDGFMKFDLSSIPDSEEVTSMTLITYYEGPAYENPNVRIYRVGDDSWSRASTVDPHPGLNEVLTPGHTSFPDTPLTPHTWSLDVGAADWTADLADDVLSLGMRNENETYSYVYWYGSDPSPAPPLLRVTFTGCSYTMVGDLNDDCKVDLFDFAMMAGNWLIDCNMNPLDPACIPK